MQQSKLSLPNVCNPFSFINNLPVFNSAELHHGSWGADSWRDANCNPENNEMLVPIIFYMDGISLDSHEKLTLTPLNMMLGIFSTEMQKSNNAWETLYFHLNLSSLNPENRDKKSVPFHNPQNLHRGLEATLCSFHSQCTKTTLFPNLPWNNKTYHISMKFAVALVVGDTELHDKLCGWYVSHSNKTAYACRHCNCKTEDFVNRIAQELTQLWIPDNFCVCTHRIQSNHWKEVSYITQSQMHSTVLTLVQIHTRSTLQHHQASVFSCISPELQKMQLRCSKTWFRRNQRMIIGKAAVMQRFMKFLGLHSTMESCFLDSLTEVSQGQNLPLPF